MNTIEEILEKLISESPELWEKREDIKKILLVMQQQNSNIVIDSKFKQALKNKLEVQAYAKIQNTKNKKLNIAEKGALSFKKDGKSIFGKPRFNFFKMLIPALAGILWVFGFFHFFWWSLFTSQSEEPVYEATKVLDSQKAEILSEKKKLEEEKIVLQKKEKKIEDEKKKQKELEKKEKAEKKLEEEKEAKKEAKKEKIQKKIEERNEKKLEEVKKELKKKEVKEKIQKWNKVKVLKYEEDIILENIKKESNIAEKVVENPDKKDDVQIKETKKDEITEDKVVVEAQKGEDKKKESTEIKPPHEKTAAASTSIVTGVFLSFCNELKWTLKDNICTYWDKKCTKEEFEINKCQK